MKSAFAAAVTDEGDQGVPAQTQGAGGPASGEQDPAGRASSDADLIMYLEPDQFVAETSVPVARAELSGRAIAGLWALRVFVVLVGAMVIYTFIEQLH